MHDREWMVWHGMLEEAVAWLLTACVQWEAPGPTIAGWLTQVVTVANRDLD